MASRTERSGERDRSSREQPADKPVSPDAPHPGGPPVKPTGDIDNPGKTPPPPPPNPTNP